MRKIIVSNNGSVLDEVTFSSTALIYLMAKLNLHLPNLAVLTLETINVKFNLNCAAFPSWTSVKVCV